MPPRPKSTAMSESGASFAAITPSYNPSVTFGQLANFFNEAFDSQKLTQ
jgi:hypothetical protein